MLDARRQMDYSPEIVDSYGTRIFMPDQIEELIRRSALYGRFERTATMWRFVWENTRAPYLNQ